MRTFINPASLLLVLLSSSTTAQLLRQGNGNLPSCASTCTTLTNAQAQCNGASGSVSTQTWSCFCTAVWTASNQNPATICSTTCTGNDNALVSQWYTQNCGSDNGASEHGGSGSGGAAPAASGSAAPSSAASSTPADTGSSGNGCSGSWFSCHWQWIVFVIVVAILLLALGFGGRWLKKRHDIKREQRGRGFNSGVTQPVHNDKAPDAYPAAGAAGARDTPSRTRDNFMPYGYGYSRSESRQERGETPVNEMEKGASVEAPPRAKSGRRVLVRERDEI